MQRHRLVSFSWLATALALVGLACGVGAAQAAPARQAPARLALPERVTGSARQVFLITGDRLLVSTEAGRVHVAVRYAARDDALTSLRYGGQLSEIPVAALPYLGRGLSPSLFQLSALEEAESGGRLPVRVAFSGDVPALAGLTVTHAGAGTETGYLTAASARAFGAALGRLFRADHGRASYGSDGMLGGVSISLAGPASASTASASTASASTASASTAPAVTRPAFPMHTLTVHALDLTGRPDDGDTIFIASADRVTRFNGLNETQNYFYRGSAKFSLPAGHYWAVATFIRFTTSGGAQLRMVVVPQFTVSGAHTALHVDGRAASSEVVTDVPRPAVSPQAGITLIRGERHGTSFLYTQSWSGFTGWVNPTTRKPTAGTLRSYTSAVLTSPAGVSPAYAYNLDFPGPAGTIPAQHFSVTAADLATVHERYYQDTPSSSGGWSTFGGTLAQLRFELVPINVLTLPAAMTQYFQAGHGLLWASQFFGNLSTFSGYQGGSYRSYGPGEPVTEGWNRYPLHPGDDASFGGLAAGIPALATADRAGSKLTLAMTPFSDNQFGHTGPGFGALGYAKAVGSYRLDQDGTEIAHGSAIDGIPEIKLGSRPATLSLTLNAARYGSFFHLSPVSQTTWTWRSAPGAGAELPRGWFCSASVVKGQYRLHRTCVVQPLMTLRYDVQGMSLAGLTAPGPQAVDVTAGHIQLGGSAAITGLTAKVSFSDGGSWYPAAVTALGAGRYRLGFTAPAGVDVTLRVGATDASGGAIAETIIRAYGTTS